MHPAAMRLTDQQYRDLISRSAGLRDIQLQFFALPERLSQINDGSGSDLFYDSLDTLWSTHLDGLIITGAEPQAATMTNEPYWPVLARLAEWACEHTISTIWSCLAAHAAVLTLDGVIRRPLKEKLSGVFQCAKVSEHHLTAGYPSRWFVPHSRHNTLDEEELINRGYSILSRAPHIGPDAFVKQVNKSLFLFLQGHPEYDSKALLREYRRDIRRFLTGQRDTYPDLPQDYFDPYTTAALLELRDQVLQTRRPELLSQFDAVLDIQPQSTWAEPAVELFSSWLSFIIDQKTGRTNRTDIFRNETIIRYG